MKENRVLVTTGMHRSGTSAVASVVQRAGVWIGSRLIEADAGNRRGYFEDEDFVRFHDEQLARSGQRVLAQVGTELEPLRRQDVRRAEKLIRRRRERDLWGWKDPRTSLYLDFWAQRLPQARFLLVFRDPVEVVLSLLRRGSGHELEVMADPLAGLRSWRFYNESILDFHQRHSDRCFLVEIDQVFTAAGGFVEAVAAKLELPLETDSAADVLHRDELHRRPVSPETEAILARVDASAVDLSRRLAAATDWAAGAGPSPVCDPALGESLRRVREMYDAVADPEAVARPVFTLLLAFLDHEATRGASPSAQVFDLLDRIAGLHQHAKNLRAEIDRGGERIRRLEDHTGLLEVRVPELESHSQGLTARLAERSQHAVNLEDRARELEAHGQGLEDLLAAALERQRELGSHVGNLESRSRRDQLRIAELDGHCKGLEKLGAERVERLEELQIHVGNLESSRTRARDRVAELEAHTGELGELLDQRSQRLRQLEAHVENLESLRQRDQAELGAHADNLEGQRSRDLERLRELGAHADNLEGQRSRDLERLRELGAHAENLESLRRRDEDRLGALGDHVDNLEQARLRDRQRVGDLEAHTGNLERELARSQARLADLEGERVRLDREVESRDRRLRDLETRQAELLERLARREATVTGLEGEARRLGGELEETLNDLRQLASSSWSKFLRRLHLLR